MDSRTWWYLARASGFVTLATSGGAVMWGLLMSTKLVRGKGIPRWLADLHRHLGALTMWALGLHVGALVADSTVHFGWAEVLVPFASDWQPLPVAAGVVAMYLLVAIEVTSLLRARISRRAWRAVHMTSALAFAGSLGHAASAGTDQTNRLYLVVAFAFTAAIAFLTILRVLDSRSRRGRTRLDGRQVVARHDPAAEVLGRHGDPLVGVAGRGRGDVVGEHERVDAGALGGLGGLRD